MNYITHLLGGAAAGAFVISAVGVNEPVQQSAIMAGAVLGSLFIDIDHRQSWIGHKAPLVAKVAAGVFKHKGFIHTPVFIVIISIILSALDWSWIHEFNYLAPYFIQGFIPGMISHIVLDTLNVQGIMWFWPLTEKRFHLMSIRTNSIFEGVVCIALAVCLYGQLNAFL